MMATWRWRPAAAPIPGQKPQQDLAGGGERASWGRSDRRVAAVRARSRAAVAACAVVASGLPRRPSGKASGSPLNPSARGGRPRARFEVDAPRRGRPRGAATMILRRPYLWLALAALSKADENYNLAVPDQDDEAALHGGRRLAGPPPRLD